MLTSFTYNTRKFKQKFGKHALRVVVDGMLGRQLFDQIRLVLGFEGNGMVPW